MTDTSPPAETATLTSLFGTAAERAEPGDPIKIALPDHRTAEYVAGDVLNPGDPVSVDPATGRLVRQHIHFAGDEAPDDGPARMDWARQQAAARAAERREALDQLDAVPVPSGLNPTSIAAARAVAGHVGSQRRQALQAFADAGGEGLTDDELAVELDMVPNRVATRRKELLDANLVLKLSATRPTRAGVDAAVHRITDLGAAAARHPEQDPTP